MTTERAKVRPPGIQRPYGNVAWLGAAHGGVARSDGVRGKARARVKARHVRTKALVAVAWHVQMLTGVCGGC
ncbi:hypothetical protein ES288_D10G078800v1 [Gossypium darwinii]|uniref:Uncharacterized protein n=2 Tax=Gossypium TaxID=3633 RepID=A0A5D2J220_GOSTO|nr:hypothetical protein ES288_D10G078800v1 [Gossypium darwinii]TYH48634.1 hypothetical protein ES332_D10G080500v1 [Gossypium tomentosum]